MENQIVVNDYRQMDKILKEERTYLLNMVKKIKKAKCNVLFIQKSILRDAVNDLSLHFLAKLGIMCVKDIERDEVEFICKVRAPFYNLCWSLNILTFFLRALAASPSQTLTPSQRTSSPAQTSSRRFHRSARASPESPVSKPQVPPPPRPSASSAEVPTLSFSTRPREVCTTHNVCCAAW